MMRIERPLRVAAMGAALCFCMSSAGAAAAPPPNVVILYADDVGFMDFGVYGGEARTANIDRLARAGALFTNYRTSPLCSPSRAMLLTGVDNHRTGVATIPEVLPPEQEGRPGYTMHLEPGVTTVAARLKDVGYRTYMTGKWHLGSKGTDLPVYHGFDRSFVLDASGADNWDDKSYMPYYKDAPWFEGAEPAALPEDFYSSDFIVDKMVDYIDEDASSDAPFFAYLAFQAVHIPVQAPHEIVRTYEGVYDAGWTALREARFARAKALGFVPETAVLADMPEGFREWDALTEQEQATLAGRMEVHAAMLEAMDRAIGRLMEELEARGELENTLFIVASDNGPEPSNPLAMGGIDLWLSLNGYALESDRLGDAGTYAFIGPEFAFATATPGDLFKFFSAEGGVHVPMVMAGPGVPQGVRMDALVNVTDLAPTILDMAGVDGPGPEGSVPMTGRSLAPLLDGTVEAVYGPDDVLGIEVSGNAALYKGRYKIVSNAPPYGDNTWELYDLDTDPGETRNLASERPDLLAELMADYAAYAERMGVLAMPDGYNVQRQVAKNSMKKIVGNYRAELIGLGTLVLAMALGLIWLLASAVRRVLR